MSEGGAKPTEAGGAGDLDRAAVAVRTLLLTDIVDSTLLVARLGDARAAEAFARHDQLARDLAIRHGGLEIDKTDGFLFLFERPVDAVLCALAYHRELAALSESLGFSLAARAGVHLGEVRLHRNAPEHVARGAKPLEVEGLAKPVTARLLGLATASQTLLTRSAFDLARRGAVGDARLDDVTWITHGSYALKGVEEPLEVFEAGVLGLAPLAPPRASEKAHPVGRVRGNLPAQLSSFVGREDDLARLKPMLESTRLLTLTGIGGCGKTRLALKLAEEVASSKEHGAWIVELAALSDPEIVVSHVATTFKLGEQPGRSALDVVTDYLREKRLLLVLDNCEHLVAACAKLADHLLRAAPGLTLLVTSREALGIAGEMTHTVASLPVPEKGRDLTESALLECAAARLFVERARSVRPDLVLDAATAASIAEACRRLDGIPLAIELAAARAKALSVAEIVSRLNDSFRLLTGGSRTALERHQTLRAAMDWSYELLEPSEQALLRRLSVFAGGWTLEAAEQACAGVGLGSADVVDLLCHLVEKSLVVVDARGTESRYWMLETVRQYAREKLRGAGEGDAVRGRHLDYFLALALSAQEGLRGKDQVTWLERLDVEHENLLAAAEHCDVAPGGAEKGLRLTAALGRFWGIRSHTLLGYRCSTEALARAGAEAHPAARGAALRLAAHLAQRLDDSRARHYAEEGLALACATGDGIGRANALSVLGVAACLEGDLVTGRALFEESLALQRSVGDESGMAWSLRNLANNAHFEGDHATALTLYAESLALSRGLGDKWGSAAALNLLGHALYQSDHALGRAQLEESLALYRELGDKRGISAVLSAVGVIAADMGHHESARALLEESLALRRDLGEKSAIAAELNRLGTLALEQGDLERSRAFHEESLALRRERASTLETLESLLSIALAALVEGDAVGAGSCLAEASSSLPEHVLPLHALPFLEAATLLSLLRRAHDVSARLAGAADGLRAKRGLPRPPVERPRWQQHLEALRIELGDDAFEAAIAAGTALDDAAALTLARTVAAPA